MNIAIIGAGPVGCYAGYLLAKSGRHQVSIYDRKPQLGLPVQCTGLLTADFDQFHLPLDSYLVNTFNHAEVYSPHKKIRIAQKEYLVCRTKFDNFFADLARKAGAEILVSHTFLRKEGVSLIIRNTVNKKEKSIAPDLVLAADGPLSPTAKAYGFYHPQRENYFGIQATVKGNFEAQTYQTFFGNEICPGLFAWIVPESSTTARVGLATKRNTRHYFDTFLQRNNFTALEIQAGAIPVYHPWQKLQKENCYLLGDAAGFVKATTLGGLVPGLKQAEILADCLNHKKDYRREVEPLAKRLRLHLKIRTLLDKFSDKDWDRLVSYVAQPRVQQVLEKYTRDNPVPLVTQALLKEPRLLYFLRYVV
ncbi:MAG TPA: NAD(P)/FAD-dependent oxidoreductase [Candidatus Nanoarchaeia archaeon]|nr:NAD(P)/FAD-dependent oxidoreductase [Candidatus Nanoarchaeia archaeon]